MPKRQFRLALMRVCLLWGLACWASRTLAGPGGELKLEVVDRDTKQPLACRIHLTNAKGQPLKAPKVPFWHDHFVISGDVTLKLPKGEYAFEIERGPEYLTRSGHFTMDDFSQDTKQIDLKRFVDMAAEGWWSGDLDIQRPTKDIELLMQADDLHVAQIVTWPDGKSLLNTKIVSKSPLVRFDNNRYYQFAAGRDARAGGTLLFFNLPRPLDLAGFKQEFPTLLNSIERAKEHSNTWVDVAKLYSWDLPVWVASGQLDSIELASSALGRKSSAKTEAGGKARDKFLFPDPQGNGRWSEAIYYHLLNCGWRIPPTAGSGSGDMANPVGYNRAYVHVEGEFTYEKWWQGLHDGRVEVTNGPLLRPTVNGELPGHVFKANVGSELELQIALSLSTRDPISYLDVIQNGELAHQVRLDEFAQAGGKLPPLTFKESGWFLVRAVTDTPNTYRFASTGPYYVEIGERPRISKESARFFLDWLNDRTKNLKLDDAKQRQAVLNEHARAREFWQGLVDRANAE